MEIGNVDMRTIRSNNDIYQPYQRYTILIIRSNQMKIAFDWMHNKHTLARIVLWTIWWWCCEGGRRGGEYDIRKEMGAEKRRAKGSEETRETNRKYDTMVEERQIESGTWRGKRDRAHRMRMIFAKWLFCIDVVELDANGCVEMSKNAIRLEMEMDML